MKASFQIIHKSKNFTNFQFKKSSICFVLLLFFSACFTLSANGQENDIKDIVPPPLALISKGETEQLTAATDMKKRTELAIELMEKRLKKAENFSNEKKYQESLDELGGFQALMRNALKHLQRNDTGSRKVFNNFKRFEINLRGFIPRLELVRRLMPEKFGYHVVQLMKSVRKARTNAVEPLFDDNVVSDN
ncbi:hypothetical protein BH20ACI4_BH20ACI4_09790 [soil metagenome]